MDDMENENLAQRVAALEANQKSIYHQLSEIKEDVKDIHRLTVAVERIAVRTETIDGKVDGIDKRLERVESAPAEDYKHFKRLIIGGFITTILAAVLTAVLSQILR